MLAYVKFASTENLVHKSL